MPVQLQPPKDPPAAPIGFRGVYDAHFESVWRSLQRLGVPDAALDDAAQDVFVTAYRAWEGLRDPDRRRAWLLGITRRVAFRHRRGRARHLRKLAAFGTAESPPRLGPEDHASRVEAGTRLQRFLDELDDDRRAAFVLGEIEELERAELGAALGINANTAYSRLQSARRSFLAHFSDDRAGADAIASSQREQPGHREASARVWLAMSSTLPGSIATAATPVLASLGGWTIAAALVVGGGLALARRAGDHAPPPRITGEVRPTHVDAPAPVAVLAAVPSPVAATPAAPTTAVVVPRHLRTKPADVPTHEPPEVAAAVPTIDEEVALLEPARRALLEGRTADARRLLAEHRRRFAERGSMTEMRDELERQLPAE